MNNKFNNKKEVVMNGVLAECGNIGNKFGVKGGY